MRPNSDNLAISHKTIAEMLQVSFDSRALSRGVNSSVNAKVECEYQDSASHFIPVDRMFPLILSLPLKLPISFALSV